ncbi:alpha/beta hydrolase [Sphaerisporangium sp. NPDC051011]|uniref:alpha/beta hydrolase n=1 Tax=Sphaerisporangium sp. NPDC051011 TaxID=3155792 RepID=UPI00340CFBFF
MVRRTAAVIASTSVVAVGVFAASGSAAATNGSQGFKRHTITEQVSLSAGGQADQTLSAVVYEPTSRPARGIQVMIPGVTYDHSYFDLKTSRGWVSQARQAAKDGWIAVAIDRLGTGNSSHPPADKLNDTAHVLTVHKLITSLKATYKGLPIALVGHSLGSAIAIQEAATYKDVNAVVATGFFHHSGVAGGLFGALIQPAAEDPKFEKRPVPSGYLTTQDGLRHLFYWPFNADLSTVEADDTNKQTATMGEIVDFQAESNNDVFGKHVSVPVLSVIGGHDTFFFNPDQRDKAIAAEPKSYPASPDAEVVAIRDAGHDLALQRNADTTTDTIDHWLAGKLR